MVQWLRLHAPNAGGLGSIPGQGIQSHMPQLKNLHAATKTRHSQILKKNFFFLKRRRSQGLGKLRAAKGRCIALKASSMEKEMATHSSILAWKNPWTEESGGLKSIGLHD